jgi:hypothetical protein
MDRRRVVITLILGLAAFGFIYAFTLRGDEEGPVITHSAVEFLFPQPGAPLEVRQAEVGVDLQAGWTGVLQIAGVEIPEDQLRRVEAQNQFFFQPGQGREFEEFPAGQLCATALIWPVTEDRDAAETVRWCFRVA